VYTSRSLHSCTLKQSTGGQGFNALLYCVGFYIHSSLLDNGECSAAVTSTEACGTSRNTPPTSIFGSLESTWLRVIGDLVTNIFKGLLAPWCKHQENFINYPKNADRNNFVIVFRSTFSKEVFQQVSVLTQWQLSQTNFGKTVLSQLRKYCVKMFCNKNPTAIHE